MALDAASAPAAVVDEPATFVDVLRRWTAERPDDLALAFFHDGTVVSDRLTYGGLDERARSIAASLWARLEPGDRAVLLYPPSLEFVAAFFGCLYAGVVAIPAYPPSPRTLHRLLAIVRDARPASLLVPASIAPLVRSGLSEHADLAGLPVVETDVLPDRSAVWQDPGVGPDSVAFLQYTSGSTASPRGVMVGHGNLLYNERMIKAGFGHDGELVGVHWLPLYHDMGLIGGVLQPIYLRVPGYLMSPLEFLRRPVTWLRAISHFRATTSGGPNFGYERCVRKISAAEREGLDLSSWTVAYNGAEPIRAETLDRFAEAFAGSGFRREALYPCYGLAEASLFVSGEPKLHGPVTASFDVAALEREGRAVPAGDGEVRRLVSSGRSWLDQRIVIADPVSRRSLADGEVGEIWLSGPHVAAGYWGRPEETEEVFGARLSDTGEGPFVRTGDLGFLLDGELFVTGRIKDVIVVRGRNHYPQDIERTAEGADPRLRPGCGAAFAVDVQCEERVVVVQEIDRPDGRPLDAAAIAAEIRRRVSTEHDVRPYAVVLIPAGEIPKTSSGKVQRRLTRRLYLAGELPILAELSRA